MNWNDFKCGRGQANERGDGARFNGECGDCRHNVEKYVAGLESKLDRAIDAWREMMSDAAPEAHKEAAKWRLLDALEGREPKP